MLIDIRDIYERYNIMPSLQEHQMRVAGVASLLCKSLKHATADTNEIVIACLLHDMGNIIKSDLSLFPAFLEPQGLDYWSKVQQDFIAEYGTDEHEATMEIARNVINDELRVADERLDKERIRGLLNCIGFSHAKENYESKDMSQKIAAYADMRVMPHGVAKLADRLKDGNTRFNLRQAGQSRGVFFQEMSAYLKKIEQQIFEQSSLSPEEITEERVRQEIQKLQV